MDVEGMMAGKVEGMDPTASEEKPTVQAKESMP